MSNAVHDPGAPRGAGMGIIAALPGEARALARLRPRGRARLDSGGQLMLSGMGRERAEAAAARLIEDGATALLSWGTAGALAPTLNAGALVIPDEVLDADDRGWPVDTRWRAALAQQLAPRVAVHAGRLVESREVLADVAAKRRLREASDAVVCDMESAAIAAVAAAHGARFVALRAIIDDAATALPPVALAAMDADGYLQVRALIGALAGRPRAVHAQLRSLKQLAVAFRAARASLARAAPVVTQVRPTWDNY